MKSKTILYLSLVLLIALAITVGGYLKAVPGIDESADNPQITITPKNFNFGEIDYGAKVKHSFKIKNIGQADLEIRKIATSCSCTSAKSNKDILLPNEEADLQVEYNSGLMTGAHAKGSQERIIYIKTNDPANPQVEVTIQAYVK